MRDTFEKVLRLKDILGFLNEDELLSTHLLLKGGTAINLTVFNLPRLSVDIDMDYTPKDTREDMLECRARITSEIKNYMESEGYSEQPSDPILIRWLLFVLKLDEGVKMKSHRARLPFVYYY